MSTEDATPEGMEQPIFKSKWAQNEIDMKEVNNFFDVNFLKYQNNFKTKNEGQQWKSMMFLIVQF